MKNNRITRKERRKKIIRRRRIIVSIGGILLVSIIFFISHKILNTEKEEKTLLVNNESETVEQNISENVNEEVEKKEILITSAGDCTLGTDTNFGYEGSFTYELDIHNNDYSRIMSNVKNIFENDDYTIVNLETTFTESNLKADKGSGIVYHFKGPKEYVNILTSSSIEGVTVSNNHIYDYGEEGFKDTINTLTENNVDYCGEGYKILKEIKGIKIGFLGYQGWIDSNELRDTIREDIQELRENGAKIIIPYFHWGLEKSFEPIETQISLARYSIDNGADMVLGSHSHVIGALENYKGKLIAYSLGNFSFGGNFNPSDKRTFILQSKFDLENDEIVKIQHKIIPALISSVEYKNDYIPTIADDKIKEEIISTLNELSPTMKGAITNDFFTLE
ncbi:MAG: CapA family protein [Clostridium sp.]|nr:CapA family protein [Clostridium sp.]MCI7444042.1 CapA family protein [Clostridium sp.]